MYKSLVYPHRPAYIYCVLYAGLVQFYHQSVHLYTIALSMRWSGMGLKALFGIFELLASPAGMPDVPQREGAVVEVDWNIVDFVEQCLLFRFSIR